MFRNLCAGFTAGALLLIVFNLLIDSNDDLECDRQYRHWPSARWRNEKQLLFVGVMTAAKYVDTRVASVWDTWARQLPGAVYFFVSENTGPLTPELPVIRLRGVDDTYPPQKKSFAMLQFMRDNFVGPAVIAHCASHKCPPRVKLDNYDWFMRADDDLYVRVGKLERFLRSLDPNKPYMLGQAGLGNSDEYGQLGLSENENYCMGGPGVIFSREALRQLGVHFESCLANLITGHEDVELGRCVRKNIGISCPWSFEMQSLFFNNQSTSAREASSPDTFAPSSLHRQGDNLQIRERAMLQKFITLHPLKAAGAMRELHAKSLSESVAELHARQMSLMREIRPLPVERAPGLVRRVPVSPEDVGTWDFIMGERLLYCASDNSCPKHTLDRSSRSAIGGIVTKLFTDFNSDARQKGRILQFKNLQYGYRRVSLRHGVDYVLDMALWYKRLRGPARDRASVAVRKHVYAQQSFGPIQALPLEPAVVGDASSLPDTGRQHSLPPTVHILLALKGRLEAFSRFAKNLLMQLPTPHHRRRVELVIAMYTSSDEGEDATMDRLIFEIADEVPTTRIIISDGEFNRAVALSRAIAGLKPDSLLLITDVDVLFTWEALERLRSNTILAKQAFFPIVFSEYSPNYTLAAGENAVGEDRLQNSRGYFRHFGYGVVSIYQSDLTRVGGFNTTIQGWGMEDVDFFERVLHSQLRILRAPEPDMVHVFHSIQCDREGAVAITEAQKEMCTGSKMHSLASFEYLYNKVTSP